MSAARRRQARRCARVALNCESGRAAVSEPADTRQSEDGSGLPFPRVRDIGFGAPFHWLARGLDDLKASPGPSLFYGAGFALMGFLISVVFRHAYAYVSALVSGFLLVGPFVALGLYELSRRHEVGEALHLGPSLTAWHRNAGSIGVYSVIIIVVFLVWARASLVVFALFYTSEMPTVTGFMQQVVSLENIEFVAVYCVVGLLFAAIVFAVSVVSIPLMLDRGQDAVTAMIASTNALFRNFPQLLMWAVLIVALTAVGFATFFLGLIVLMPIIGHATWHAYRDLVEPMPVSSA
ncbi:MAG: DUF2189 domain-containing protein [Sterolibacteriaceae bacterium]|uniref:DUF2189 domain-containing protein n=1 Tax=Candidatus Methylophosphatis roskildensis TaxID=2899263 RepID=A0A9D7E5Y0_9PROT|nr:DUF2189 domain-containing protein [Candidatus Methylophosphatis roskildensis]